MAFTKNQIATIVNRKSGRFNRFVSLCHIGARSVFAFPIAHVKACHPIPFHWLSEKMSKRSAGQTTGNSAPNPSSDFPAFDRINIAQNFCDEIQPATH